MANHLYQQGKPSGGTIVLMMQLLLIVLISTTNAFTNPSNRRTASTTAPVVGALHSAPAKKREEIINSEEDDEGGEKKKKEKSEFLPDYGKTTVEVDTIKLVKPKRKKKKKKNDVKTTKTTTTNKLHDIQKKWTRDDLFGNTLIDQTLAELKVDDEFLDTQERIATIGEKKMAANERKMRQRALGDDTHFPHTQMKRSKPTLLQLNIGLYCNQACAHCHVESSPLRKQDVMSDMVAARCLKLLEQTPSIKTVDITGGAPELCPAFRFLVATIRAKFGNDIEIIDRCNLTVLQEPGQEDLVEFLKMHNVHIIASLPCYSSENVNKQRGNGVFDRSIASLIALNRAGYGIPHAVPIDDNDDDSSQPKQNYHQLDLVYNPLGAFLPPPQEKLQVQYKEQLANSFGITFNNLYTITNMPIKRFADFLYRRDELRDYMDLLQRNYNPSTLDSLMCKDTINIGHTGKVFDCDFNQQLGYSLGITDDDGDDTIGNDEQGLTVFDIKSFDDLAKYTIRNDNHCFGCTAGMGSS